MPNDQISLDAYIRVSRVAGREGESYISPSVQREAIQRWADYKGVSISEWIVDEDQSGGKDSRPGLDRAVARALAGETAGIVAHRIDRLHRNTEHGLATLRRLQGANARLAFVAEEVDTATPGGRFFYTIMLAVAEMFLETIKASWITAKTRAVARGAAISRTPWGYERQEDGTLAPHPERAPLVTEAFRLAASDSIQAAMFYLRRVAPERRWNTTKVRRLLSQRSYLGETRYGDLVKLNTHEALVSRAIWEAARSTPARRQASASFPLSGFVLCGTCRQPLVGGRSGRNADRVYRCSASSVQSLKECKRPAVITALLLEDYVREIAKAVLSDSVSRVTIYDDDAEATILEQAILEAESELDAFAADLTMRRALGERYHAHLQARVEAVEQARHAYREKVQTAQKRISLSVEDLLDPDHPERLLVGLRGLFESIIVNPGRIPIAKRVRILPLKDDRTTGELGTKDAQVFGLK